jgi:predicted RNase H-like HicB family nuclease
MAETTARIYTAVARRSGGWWAISVPEIKGVHSQARRLDQVPVMAAEAIALMLDVDPSTIAVQVQPQAPGLVAKAMRARRDARTAESHAEEATAAAVLDLLDAGYTVRDAGQLLELSPQRISQIAARARRNQAA